MTEDSTMEHDHTLRTDSIHSLTDFRQNAAAHLDRLNKDGGVEVLTVNGQAKGVVMSPKVYDELAERARQAEITAKIRQGMAEIAAGQSTDSDGIRRRLTESLGIDLAR